MPGTAATLEPDVARERHVEGGCAPSPLAGGAKHYRVDLEVGAARYTDVDPHRLRSIRWRHEDRRKLAAGGDTAGRDVVPFDESRGRFP